MPSISIQSRHGVIIDALARLLVSAGFRIATDGDERPDLALVDLCHELQPFQEPPNQVPSIALVCGSDDDLDTILQLGYRGYLRAHDDGERLLQAAAAVLSGEVWAERKVLGRLIGRRAHPNITKRELDVLHEIARGRSNHEIAEHLGMAVKTVKAHVSQLYAKLDAESRVALTLKARTVVFEVTADKVSRRPSTVPSR